MPLFGIRKGIKNTVKSALGLNSGPATTVPEWTPPPPVRDKPSPAVEQEEVKSSPIQAAPVDAAPLESEEIAAPDEQSDVSAEEGMELNLENVEEVIDDFIRPGVQADGGNIELIKIENNDVYVRLTGACQSCSSAIMTMKMGVEALLREEFPSMRELIDETDYAA